MAEERDGWSWARRLFNPEAATEEWPHADRRQWVAPDEAGKDALRPVAAGDVAIAEVESEEPIDGPSTALDVLIFGRRDRFDKAPLAVGLWICRANRDEPVGVRVREW